MKNYTDFTEEMNRHEWYSTKNILTHKSDIIHNNEVKKHNDDIFLSIKLPLGHYNKILSICGMEQCDVKNNELPHRLAIRCTDINGNELYKLSEIQIIYYQYNPAALIPTGVIDDYTQMGLVDRLHHHYVDQCYYRDISQVKGSRYKQREEKYYLRHKGVYLVGGDKLLFGVFNPDIDIVKTELFMEYHLWQKINKQT